ncbi:MAG: hypothetical protein HYX37_06210 [Rhizobiales bacterium]|nr:hypothetical protein [Hyphomicrobiales bacterium]
MSFWSDIGDAVSGAADAVAGAVETVVNAVEEVVTDVVETVGNAVSDAAGAVGDFLSGVPLIGGALSAVFHWIGDVVSGVTDLVGAVIKGYFGIVGGVIGGLIRVIGGGIGGLFNGDGSVFVKGLGDIVSGYAGAIVVVGGKLIGLVQSVIPLQWGKRPLTRSEKEILKRVFRGSVALYNIRIIEGFAGVYSINPYPFTLGNTIYLKDVDPAKSPAILVHECTHVWQYQNHGTRYASDAIGAQWFVNDAYNWEKELARGNTQWQDFNAEAEAEFMEDVYAQGRVIGTTATGNGEYYNDEPLASNIEFVFTASDGTVTDHSALARDTVPYVRDAFAWRLSALLG